MPTTPNLELAIIIVDHGSRRMASNQMLFELVKRFRARGEYRVVEAAHMELAEPSIAQAFDLCVEQGAKTIVINPYFLLPGRHWDQDIPRLAAEAASRHPGVKYLVTAPLALHQSMTDIISDRISHCLARSAGEVGECEVCAGTGKCRMLSANPPAPDSDG